MSQKRVEIPKPTVNVNLDHLNINLVSLDKVKLYVNEIENLPWISGLGFLFAGALLDRIITLGTINDSIVVILFVVILIFAILSIRIYMAKVRIWADVEESKIDLHKNK